jgi:two-component system, response regulator PdtaR
MCFMPDTLARPAIARDADRPAPAHTPAGRTRPGADHGPTAAARPPLRVVVADADPASGRSLQALLPRLGHEACAAAAAPQLAELCRALRPDLVIADAALPGLAEAAAEVWRDGPVPFVLVTDADPAPFGDAVFARLARPVTEAALGPAVAVAVSQFERSEALRREVAELRQALEERKLVERAKGAVVKRTGVPEDEAFRRLRKYASDRNLKLADAARSVLNSEAVFADLDDGGGYRHHAAACVNGGGRE